MTAIAATDISVSIVRQRSLSGRERRNLVKLTFGDSALTYPSGGIDVSSTAFASKCGFPIPISHLIPVQPLNLTSAVQWEFDPATTKLRGFAQGHVPPIVINESVTLSSHAGTLKYPPALIISATGTISATITALKLIPSTATVATTEIAMNMTTGSVLCFASDSVSALTISYIPQQPFGPFSAANMVTESIALATGDNNLTSRAAAINYVYQTTATAARLVFAHAAGSGKLALDFHDTGATQLNAHSAQNGKTVTVNYLKYSGFTNNTDVAVLDQATHTLTSEAIEFGLVAGQQKNGLYIPALGGQIVTFHDTSTYDEAYLFNETGTPGNGSSSFNIATQVLTTAQTGDSETIVDVPMLFLSNLTTAPRGFRELTTNDAPSSTVLYFEAVA